jgi:hypothetical protein
MACAGGVPARLRDVPGAVFATHPGVLDRHVGARFIPGLRAVPFPWEGIGNAQCGNTDLQRWP